MSHKLQPDRTWAIIKKPQPDRRTWAIIILMVAVALHPNPVGYRLPTGERPDFTAYCGLRPESCSPSNVTLALRVAAVPVNVNFRYLMTPFWKLRPYHQDPLAQAYVCADKFGPPLKTASRVAYFYQKPHVTAPDTFPGAPDYRLIEMQYVLAPLILDNRLEAISDAQWVIGYFENEKLADNEAQALAPVLGLEVDTICGNYVLFRRTG